MIEFVNPLIGGVLIGAVAVAMLLLLGRITGISGILWGAVTNQADSAWRWMFVLGLVLGPLIYHQLSGIPSPTANSAPWFMAVIAGLLVGIGVKMGSGCTSGHGVCGLGRLSIRSLAATITFMAVGIITVFVTRHLF